jgi:hypothetical protein
MGSRTGTAAAHARQEKRMTTVEYLETPETVQPRELIYGELHVADAPTVTHSVLSAGCSGRSTSMSACTRWARSCCRPST